MVFFHLEDGSGHTTFAVNSFWWLYLVVTIPLTIVVGFAWYQMLKRKGYGKLQARAMDSLGVETNSSQPAPGGSKSQ